MNKESNSFKERSNSQGNRKFVEIEKKKIESEITDNSQKYTGNMIKKRNDNLDKESDNQQINISMNIHPDEKNENPVRDMIVVSEDQRVLRQLKNVFDSCDEKEMKLDREPWILIEIESNFKLIWEFFMLFSIFYSAFWTPLNLCFSKVILVHEVIDVVIEIALIADIFLSFCTQIEDASENIISSSKIITYSYLKGWFFLDIITCFPASLIQFFDRESMLITYLKWFGLVRLLKIIKYPFLTNKMIVDNERIDRIIKQFISLIIMINTLSCFFIFLGLNTSGNNWISTNLLNDSDDFEIYISSLFFHAMTLTTIGFANIEGVNNKERIYTILLFILVSLLFPFTIISISKIFSDDDPSQIVIYSKLQILKKVQKKFRIGKNLENQISQTLKFENEKKFRERENFFQQLPFNIKHQLNSYLFQNKLNKFLFYQNQSYEFILFTIPFLRHSFPKKGQMIYTNGEMVDEMFLVIKGSLSLSLGPDFLNLEVAVLRENNYFGDIFLFTNKISPFDCKSKSNRTEIFCINSEDYSFIKRKYPKNILNIIENSEKTLSFLNGRKKNLLNLLEQEKTKENVILRLKEINAYLLQRDFNDYFSNNKEIEGVNEFLINNPFSSIKSLIKKMGHRPKKFPTHKITDNTNFKKLLQLEKISHKNIMNSSSLGNKYQRSCKNIHDLSTIKNEKETFQEIEVDKFEKRVKKFLNLPQVDEVSEAIEKTVLPNSQTIMRQNFFTKTINGQFTQEISKPASKEVISKKKRKKLMKQKFLKILNEIYQINFEQSLDVNSMKKEKEIEKNISQIIVDNKKAEAIINDIDPEFKDNFKKRISISGPPPIRSNYTFEKLKNNNLKFEKSSNLRNETELYFVKESSFFIQNSPYSKTKTEKGRINKKFVNLKVSRNYTFSLSKGNRKTVKFVEDKHLSDSQNEEIIFKRKFESEEEKSKTGISIRNEFSFDDYIKEIIDNNQKFIIKDISVCFQHLDRKLNRIMNYFNIQ